jgi:HD domain
MDHNDNRPSAWIYATAAFCHIKECLEMTETVAGIRVPDSAMARAATQLVRDTEDDLLYNHSRRVFFWGALTGERRGLKFDPELLYMGAMFHDMGLTERYSSADLRFEVDGANVARDFLRGYGVPERDIEDVWTAIALHTTPGVPEHMRPTIALVTAGVEMDVLGIGYDDFSHQHREHVCAHHPREDNFKENIIDHFANGIIKKPLTTFGNVKADVLALKDPSYRRMNFCSIILDSPWPS